ncbi:hypothetical protein U1Q18_041923 [Sarracenia purpurea var. burkii]
MFGRSAGVTVFPYVVVYQSSPMWLCISLPLWFCCHLESYCGLVCCVLRADVCRCGHTIGGMNLVGCCFGLVLLIWSLLCCCYYGNVVLLLSADMPNALPCFVALPTGQCKFCCHGMQCPCA